MNESFNHPVPDNSQHTSEPFYQIWIKAVTRPNERTYAEIANSPGANPAKAYLWIALSWLSSYILVMLGLAVGNTSSFNFDFEESLASLLCTAPITAPMSAALFALHVAIIQWIAKMFKGVGSYNQLVYAIAAFSAPISLVSGLLGGLSAIPFIGLCFSIIGIGLSIYTIVMMIMAVKGVNRFGWGEAIGSVFLPGILIGFICGCLVIAILLPLGLGPIIGDVFSTINQSLGGN